MNSEFKIEDLCALIKACRSSGVSELKFKDLSVSFLPKLESGAWVIPQSLPDNEISEDQIKKFKQESLEREEAQLKEDQLRDMPLLDPEAYEDLQALGDLTNGEV